ncbi:MAG: PIN/TRAM domain-containing protein [Opitutales bacterium]
MKTTILTIRIFFFALCLFGAWLLWDLNRDWSLSLTLFIGGAIGALVILTDMLLKGFSLRGMTALTFGLAVGAIIATFISNSPLFEPLVESGDQELAGVVFLVRLVLYVILMYLGAVIALRGRDEFYLVIPYVRFVPHGVTVPLAVVDTSILVDGRILPIVEKGWLGYALVIPRFVLDELHAIADSSDPQKRASGRKGLDVLNALRRIENLDIRIPDSEVKRGEEVDAKLVFLAQNMKARLMTTDLNLAKMAEFHGVQWLNINDLARALNPELVVGQTLEVELVRPGKEADQAVGYLPDGSMVVVNGGRDQIGERVQAEIISVLPTSGGRMIFGKRPGSD